MFFEHNSALGPPYHVLLDTNFINFSIQHKLDIFKSLMDVLVAKAIPCISDCVIAELEKMMEEGYGAGQQARAPYMTRGRV